MRTIELGSAQNRCFGCFGCFGYLQLSGCLVQVSAYWTGSDVRLDRDCCLDNPAPCGVFYCLVIRLRMPLCWSGHLYDILINGPDGSIPDFVRIVPFLRRNRILCPPVGWDSTYEWMNRTVGLILGKLYYTFEIYILTCCIRGIRDV